MDFVLPSGGCTALFQIVYLLLPFPFRTFRLRLRRDAGTFSGDFKVVGEDGATTADLSHLYSGTLEGRIVCVCVKCSCGTDENRAH